MSDRHPALDTLAKYIANHTNPPQVNLNGMSGQQLSANWEAVKDAAEILHEALRRSMPHGRDYQTCSDPAEALGDARDAHLATLDAVNLIIDYANAVRSSLADQGYYGGVKIGK